VGSSALRVRRRVVVLVRIPCAGKQRLLPRYSTALHMHGINEAGAAASPIASPDQPVLLGKPAEKSEIAFARGLAGDVFDQVASKPIEMHAHGFELGCPLMIEPRLPRLASVGLVGHELDAGGGCISDDYEHFAARHRLEQRKIVDRLKACEARVLPHGVGVEVAHAQNLLFLV
jgi:hypothetical protein